MTRPAPKHDNWRDPRVAAEYERRRFAGRLGAAKQAHDGRLLRRILDAEVRGAPRPLRLLDLPVGTGRLLGDLAASGDRPIGADRSLEMLAVAAARPDAVGRLVQADARRLPFADEAFDAVVAMRFLFHIADRAERVAMLGEMGRVSRGPVVVQVRHRANAKQAGRWLRGRLGLTKRWRPAPSSQAQEGELADAGLRLERALPVSRLLSDKLLLVARRA